MAITFGGALGSATNKTTGTTVTLVTGAVVPIGAVVVVIWAADNLTASTPLLSSVTDTRSNTYTILPFTTNTSATANAGQVMAIAISKITTSLGSGDVINAIASSASTTVKAVDAAYFLGASTIRRATPTVVAGTTTAASVVYASGLSGDLLIGAVANQNNALPTGDTDTLNGSWVVLGGVASTGGGAAANISIYSQYKILTASGSQTYNATLATQPYDAMAVALVPAIQQTASNSGLGSETATGNIPSVGINHSYWGTDALL